jgi:hypothetical protein
VSISAAHAPAAGRVSWIQIQNAVGSVTSIIFDSSGKPYSTASAIASSTTPNTCMVGSVTTRHRVHIGVHAPRAGRVQIEDRQRELDARGQPTASERRAFAAVVARLMWSSIAVAGFDLEKSRYRPFQAELVRGAGRRPHAELARCHLLRVEIDRGRRLRAR